jgi:hypothetical protein
VALCCPVQQTDKKTRYTGLLFLGSTETDSIQFGHAKRFFQSTQSIIRKHDAYKRSQYPQLSENCEKRDNHRHRQKAIIGSYLST